MKHLRFPFFLLVALLLVYSNCWQNGFHLDDYYGIVNNPAIRDLSVSGVVNIFTDPYTSTTNHRNADWRPLTTLSYAVSYALSGVSPWGFHLLNLALHWLACLGLRALGLRLLGEEPGQGGIRRNYQVVNLGTFLFAVSPIANFAPNYSWARSSVLVAAFLTWAIYWYDRSFDNNDDWMAVLSWGLFGAALLCKAEAVCYLGLLLLVERRQYLFLEQQQYPFYRGGLILRMSIPTAIFLLYSVVRSQLMPGWVKNIAQSDYSPLTYLLTQMRVWWHYLSQCIYPSHLVLDDTSYPVSRGLLEADAALPGVSWLWIGVALVLFWRKDPLVAFCGSWFFVCLLPHSSIIPLAEMTNEHRPYLAVGPLFLLSSEMLYRFIKWFSRFPVVIHFALLLQLTVGYASLSHERNLIWKDDLSLWKHVVTTAPLAMRAQMNYGVALMARGQFKEAEGRFRETIRLAPTYSTAHTNLALVLDYQGRLEEAFKEHNLAIHLGGHQPEPWFWRAVSLHRRRALLEAEKDLVMALGRDPRHIQAKSLLDLVRVQLKAKSP